MKWYWISNAAGTYLLTTTGKFFPIIDTPTCAEECDTPPLVTLDTEAEALAFCRGLALCGRDARPYPADLPRCDLCGAECSGATTDGPTPAEGAPICDDGCLANLRTAAVAADVRELFAAMRIDPEV
jgi:hypothetical protein